MDCVQSTTWTSVMLEELRFHTTVIKCFFGHRVNLALSKVPLILSNFFEPTLFTRTPKHKPSCQFSFSCITLDKLSFIRMHLQYISIAEFDHIPSICIPYYDHFNVGCLSEMHPFSSRSKKVCFVVSYQISRTRPSLVFFELLLSWSISLTADAFLILFSNEIVLQFKNIFNNYHFIDKLITVNLFTYNFASIKLFYISIKKCLLLLFV